MAATMPPPSDDLYNVFWWIGLRLFQTRIDITVQGILEKSPTSSTAGTQLGIARSPANVTDTLVSALGKDGRNSSATQLFGIQHSSIV
jgi:hypothetical protein